MITHINDLSDVSITILDCLLNLPSVHAADSVFETVALRTQKEKAMVEDMWDNLVEGNIVIKKEHQFVLNPLNIDKIKEQVEIFLKKKKHLAKLFF